VLVEQLEEAALAGHQAAEHGGRFGYGWRAGAG